jgi:hypothetical protein
MDLVFLPKHCPPQQRKLAQIPTCAFRKYSRRKSSNNLHRWHRVQCIEAAGGGLNLDGLLQVNPLAETRDGTLVSADAKLGFDDNAFFRQKELFSMRDESQEDARSPSLLIGQSPETSEAPDPD